MQERCIRETGQIATECHSIKATLNTKYTIRTGEITDKEAKVQTTKTRWRNRRVSICIYKMGQVLCLTLNE